MEPTTFSSRRKPPPPQPPPLLHSSTRNNSDFLTGGGGYFSTSYDDVFGGPPKYTAAPSTLAPRAEDYSEIFGGFRTSSSARASSSIPVLDLPVVNSADFDAVFDYSDVFGGLNAVHFAVPFDELFRSPHGFGNSDDDNDGDDDDAAWTPIGSESLSDDSDPFAFSVKSQCFQNGKLHQPLEGQQFNVSYHKVNPGTSTCMPNMVHVAKLNDVPGYTCVVEEATSLREMAKERSCSPVVEDIVINTEPPSELSVNNAKKTMTHLSQNGADLKAFNADARPGRSRSASMSHLSTISVSDYDINLTMKSSQLPPPARDSRLPSVPVKQKSDLSGEKNDLEATGDGTLPSFFDMELDVGSTAAASAAVMKDVMDKAQVKLKAAREFRGRKDSFHNSEKMSLKTDEDEVSLDFADSGCLSEEHRKHSMSDIGRRKIKSSSKSRHDRNISQILPDIVAAELPIDVNAKTSDTMLETKSSVSRDAGFTQVAGGWKEDKQFFEYVNSDSPKTRHQPSCKGDEKIATFEQHENEYDYSDSAQELCVPEENRRRLKVTKAVSRQQYYDKMVKVAQEVHDTVTSGNAEANKGSQENDQGDKQEPKCKVIIETEYEAKSQDSHQEDVISAEDVNNAEEDALENEDVEKKDAKAVYRTQNGTNSPQENSTEDAPKTWAWERRVKDSCDMGELPKGVVDVTVREQVAQSAEALRARKLNEEGEVKDLPPKEDFENVFGEIRRTTCESQQDRIQDVQQMKALDKRRDSSIENAHSEETLRSTCEGPKIDKSTEGHQRCDHEVHFENTTTGQGFEENFDQYDGLEKCWEYLEVLEQETNRMNMHRKRDLVGNNNSVESQKQDENEEKLKMSAESNCLEAVELGENANILENSVLKEDRNDVCTNNRSEGKFDDQEPDISPGIEPPTDYKHPEISNGANPYEIDVELDAVPSNLKMPNINAFASFELPAEKDGEIGMEMHAESKLKAVGSTNVQTDAIKEECTVAQIDSSSEEPEGTAAHISLQTTPEKADGSEELSTRKENGDVTSLVSDKGRSRSVETSDATNIPQTVSPTVETAPAVRASHKVNMSGKTSNSGGASTRHEHVLTEEDKKAEPVTYSKISMDSKVELGGKVQNQGVGKVFNDLEGKARPTQTERINGWGEHTFKVGANSVMRDRKESFQRTSQVPGRSQSIERKGSIYNHYCPSDEKGKSDLEKEHLRKLEEEREREIERQKDRSAVEIAVREARERAYADARDRAERAALERATDEARQKAMAEARERLEKACAEARERSLGDKSSEARLRAERAAVERATAEARQRAIEKAMADVESRERMQRSVSDKYIPERDVMMRQSSFPSTSDRFDTEPAQRCKARLERNRRTVERVAKALAEKNMRDLIAQREQAERNRMAETLDADIKRWSSGKAGNLRALLSTLQYILGPDSGWHPIPLTEVITAAAVKKAYRKATLCVHPDKLQQRGASIQQKYICEKVFDLLKEAWNKFNSEEK